MTSRRIAPVADYRPRIRREASVAAARERLAFVDAGGALDRPIHVESASQIEPRALGTPCSRCDGPYRFDEHTAERLDEGPSRVVRAVRVHCGHCGAPRTFYFRVVEASPS